MNVILSAAKGPPLLTRLAQILRCAQNGKHLVTFTNNQSARLRHCQLLLQIGDVLPHGDEFLAEAFTTAAVILQADE